MLKSSFFKKILILALVLALMVPLMTSIAPVAYAAGSSTMYVKTDDGKVLYLRKEPQRRGEVVGRIPYGAKVELDWSYAGNDGWSRVKWNNKEGFVQTRYLVNEDPGPYKKPTKAPGTPKPTKDPKKEAEELKKKQAELNKELENQVEVKPYYIAVRPTRASGWVNVYVGPGTITAKSASYAANKELIVLCETLNWLQARDPETGKVVGYIQKSMTTKLDKPVVIEEEGTTTLGTLTVNGEFELTCKLPEGYKLQVVEMRGESIIASVTSDDVTKPQMYLSIAYDELYADVQRMNDLDEDRRIILEQSFTSMDDVDITKSETHLGTELMVVRNVGSGTDFVDFVSIYDGYLIEFNMTPNPSLGDQRLTDEQIEVAIQFLTDVMFNPVEK